MSAPRTVLLPAAASLIAVAVSSCVFAAAQPTGAAGAPDGPQTAPASTPATAPGVPPLSDRRLAAGVIFGCADSRDRAGQRAMARTGIGGIVLLGTSPPSDLRSALRSVQRAAPKGHHVVIASDEEGGAVQRLATLIHRLPSAETMGTWSDGKIRTTARSYGRAMKSLGVDMALAPVADLRVPGTYIDSLNRAFSSDPERVGAAVVAWSRGLDDAGAIAVAKHWPGHGHAVDTHQYAARVPALSQLRRADLLPFQTYFEKAPRPHAVMVAHVQSKGLTAAGQPATQSPRAMSLLRKQAGPDAVIMTDSLSMAAATSARGLTESEAVVAALRAGADWAMVCTANPRAAIGAVTRAVRSGDLDRRQLEKSLERIASLVAR